jgi:hypothetical protein
VHGSLFSRRGLAIVAVSVVSLIGCCLLAWWQWTRYQSASGTLQNLGYVLQWPLFGIFPAFMFYRIHKAGQERAAEAAEAAVQQPEPATDPVPAQRTASDTASDTGWNTASNTAPSTPSMAEWNPLRAYVQNTTVTYEDTGPDGDLVAYNQYLARLAAQEDRNAG